MLLEKEREEKFAVIRGKEKLERDLNSYSHALKDKDSRIAVLSTRVKQLERDHFEAAARLKKEAEDYKQQYHTASRKCRQLQARLDAQPKAIDPLSPRFPASLSPPRELLYGLREVHSPAASTARKWVSPGVKCKKGARPNSAQKSEISVRLGSK